MGQMKEISIMIDEYVEREMIPPIVNFIEDSATIELESVPSANEMIKQYIWTKVVNDLRGRIK